MATRTHARPLRLLLALTAVSATAFGLLPLAAQAEPTPSLDAVAAQLDALQQKADQAVEAYNSAQIALDAASRKAAAAAAKLSAEQDHIGALRASMGQTVAAAYRSGSSGELMTLVTTSNPQTFLDQASSLDRLAKNQSAQLSAVQVARHQLATDRQVADRELAVQQAKRKQLADSKAAVEKTLADTQAVLSRLKAEDAARVQAQREASQTRSVAAAAPAAVPDSTPAAPAAQTSRPTSGGAASGRASAAVQFAYAQLGKPYQYGAAGPNAYDCSGLTMRAWEAGGVSLSHSSQAQWSEGRHVSQNEIQPGDLLFYHSLGHVAIYVGNGMQIAASTTGTPVHMQAAFYSGYQGAVRVD
ncbi:MAG: NlpC/P60 family protein [Actinomycetota bacterium]|nr:NlpC/P60 family protein [Actinomycetota bacterium]